MPDDIPNARAEPAQGDTGTLRVRSDVLRCCAGDLADAAHRIGQGLTGSTGLTVPAPDWSAAGALAALESAVHSWFTRMGGQLAHTADGMRAAADDYDAADERAARRLLAAG